MEFRDPDYLSSCRQTTGLREKCNQAGYTFVLVIQQKRFPKTIGFSKQSAYRRRSCASKLAVNVGGIKPHLLPLPPLILIGGGQCSIQRREIGMPELFPFETHRSAKLLAQ